jgi:hypothetical protein
MEIVMRRRTFLVGLLGTAAAGLCGMMGSRAEAIPMQFGPFPKDGLSGAPEPAPAVATDEDLETVRREDVRYRRRRYRRRWGYRRRRRLGGRRSRRERFSMDSGPGNAPVGAEAPRSRSGWRSPREIR